ncbi:MAG: FtsX-like permease family protein, partial [Saccharolobus sp.]
VYQRIREIGIMKTLGLTTKDILLIFLSESGFIGLIGGVIGVILGLMTSSVIDILSAITTQTSSTNSAGAGFGRGPGFFRGASSGGSVFTFKPVISVEAIIISLVVSIIVSLIAGIYPAWRAAKLTPVEAIRRD